MIRNHAHPNFHRYGPLGWQQDDTHLAFLGLAQQTRGYVHTRASRSYEEARFPAMWELAHDWIPDQCQGGNLVMAVQTMLMQCEDRKILLFPAWPKQWDVEFKLNAPYKTTVEGSLRDGKLVDLKVIPQDRRKDVKLLATQ